MHDLGSIKIFLCLFVPYLVIHNHKPRRKKGLSLLNMYAILYLCVAIVLHHANASPIFLFSQVGPVGTASSVGHDTLQKVSGNYCYTCWNLNI